MSTAKLHEARHRLRRREMDLLWLQYVDDPPDVTRSYAASQITTMGSLASSNKFRQKRETLKNGHLLPRSQNAIDGASSARRGLHVISNAL